MSKTASKLKVNEKDFRAILTVYQANKLTAEDRYNLINWLHATANAFGHDDYDNDHVAPTFHARLMR